MDKKADLSTIHADNIIPEFNESINEHQDVTHDEPNDEAELQEDEPNTEKDPDPETKEMRGVKAKLCFAR